MIPIKLINGTWPPNVNQYHSTIFLNYTDWDDYGYRTSFYMFYSDKNGTVHEIGGVKIYFRQNDERRNKNYFEHTRKSLGSFIKQLDQDYCSLGEDLSYYKNMKECLPNDYMEVFRRLNDIAIDKELQERFVNEEGVQNSLLRFSGAEKALLEARDIVFNNEVKEKNISFKYRVKVPYDESPADLQFDFKKSDCLPYRINALIGKNGTGKTQILSSLANSLSGYTDNHEDQIFINNRPPIDKVMSISYSAFDSFKKPPEDNGRSVFSYVYCGIQSEKGTLSLTQLKQNLKNSYDKVKSRDREPVWRDVLSELMEAEHQRTVKLIGEEQFDEINLSSGQQILICTITELIANIENESIILFDEPEIHLHPNAVANVMRMFYRLLEQYNSYAVFSTHSPLVLQEIPSRYIQILDRMDDMLIIRKPDVECFGNNISDIISDVFDVSSAESNYKTYLNNLSQKMTYDEILELFNDQLSLNALIYLKNCYSGRAK